jgi:hypothetical protein
MIAFKLFTSYAIHLLETGTNPRLIQRYMGHSQLPGHHFMITFTVPEQLRRFIRSNQRAAYAAMFTASSQTLKKLTPDPKYIGGDLPGFFGVLHTWGHQLQYHPHIHYIVPGEAISKDDGLSIAIQYCRFR